jgi:hypothetical protein
LEIASKIKAKLKELLINTTLPALRRTIRLITIGNNRISKLLEGKGQVLMVRSTTRAA